MATPTSGADTWLTINNKPLHFGGNDENLHVQALEKQRNFLRVTPAAPGPLEISVDGKVLDTAVYGSWYWRPEKYAGLYVLEVQAPDEAPQRAAVRVLPEKVTQERFEAMLADISSVAIDLLFRLNSPASEKVQIEQRTQDPSPLREYRQLEVLLQEFKEVMAQIRRNPQHVLAEHAEVRLLHEVPPAAYAALPIVGPVQAFPDQAGGTRHLPLFWQVPRRVLTYDVHENRLLKQFVLRQLVTRLALLKERAAQEITRREAARAIKLSRGWDDDETIEITKLQQVIGQCKQLAQWCIAWGSEPFLQEVQPFATSGRATQVLLKNPAYSRFYRLYLRFQQELRISLNTEHYLTLLALRKVWDLYEIWSVFQLTHLTVEILLRAGYTFTSSTFFYEVERDCFQFEVRKNVAGVVLTRGDVRVEMKYEPRYLSHLSVGNRSTLATRQRAEKYFTPDLAIEVYRQGVPRHVLIFDAKYSWERERDGSHGPHDDDINKMHMYRNMICYKVYDPRRNTPNLYPIVSSAYILYPGDMPYQEPGKRIGALPFVPRMLQRAEADVARALKEILRLANLL